MNDYAVGDLVVLSTGQSGVVSGIDGPRRHVLVLDEGEVVGLDVGYTDMSPADENSEGWAQLSHALIELGSHIIGERFATNE